MSPHRRYSKPQRAAKACRKHPGVPAAPGSDLCKNCKHYADLTKKENAARKAAAG